MEDRLRYFILGIFIIIFWTVADTLSPFIVSLNDCDGGEYAISGLNMNKLRLAKNLFSRQPIIQNEPAFFIKMTDCYNAWADTKNNKIIFSEPLFINASVEDLAGIMAHEFAHLEAPASGQESKTDVRGAELVGKKIMFQSLSWLKDREVEYYSRYSLVLYIFPSLYYSYSLMINELSDRIEIIKSLPSE